MNKVESTSNGHNKNSQTVNFGIMKLEKLIIARNTI